MKEYLIIEPIKNENFDEFIYLIEKLAEYEKLAPPDEKAKMRLKKHGLSKKPFYEAYLGKVDDTYVGYVIFFTTYSSFVAKPTLHLEDIFVLEEFRKKGIGQKLFNFIVSKAKERDCGRVDWQVLDWNQIGINFYKKNNAKHMNDWLNYRLTSNQFDDFL